MQLLPLSELCVCLPPNGVIVGTDVSFSFCFEFLVYKALKNPRSHTMHDNEDRVCIEVELKQGEKGSSVPATPFLREAQISGNGNNYSGWLLELSNRHETKKWPRNMQQETKIYDKGMS